MEEGPKVDALAVIEKIKAMPNGAMMVDLAVERCLSDQKDEIIRQLTAQHEPKANPETQPLEVVQAEPTQ